MARAWGILRKTVQNKSDNIKQSLQLFDKQRIDLDLPLGLRFAGIVEFSEIDFILGGDQLKIKHPGQDSAVIAYGQFQVGPSTIRRFYLDASGNVYVLQIVTDSRNIVDELRLFMPFDLIFPTDWDFWLADQNGYIGLNIFQTKDGIQYFRVWGNDDDANALARDIDGNRITRIPPVMFSENLYRDKFGSHIDVVNYQSMLYGRHVNDNVDEYLLLSAVEDNSGASVEIMVGIDLAPSSIKVI